MSIAGAILLPTLLWAQAEQPPRIRTGINVVEVDVVVVDDNGVPVRGLQQHDFRAEEDGRPAEIASFTAIGAADAERAGNVAFAAAAVDSNGNIRARQQFASGFIRTPADKALVARVATRLDVPAGRYQVRIAAAAKGVRGSVFTEVEVPQFNKPINLGGLTLAIAVPIAEASAQRLNFVLPSPRAARRLTRPRQLCAGRHRHRRKTRGQAGAWIYNPAARFVNAGSPTELYQRTTGPHAACSRCLKPSTRSQRGSQRTHGVDLNQPTAGRGPAGTAGEWRRRAAHIKAPPDRARCFDVCCSSTPPRAFARPRPFAIDRGVSTRD